ncbi:low temperature requirement protein A [Kutzneria viridogrisea]|uniref:Low temperature requirement protein LtrA n=1 Tax=Kutzneria viridogrisea TaxID=47990 RepID=A0ABR6BNT9_9PSEU|nr:low temperature requirement protein LtrA [Kutzneria viridogrisea]
MKSFARPWYRPMSARSMDEQHRVATPLELFFDLCFVVAVSLAASSLHHMLAEAHFGLALLRYAMVFFAIWWAWMNFTWFASAYDTDDGVYRLTTLVQIAGVLIFAAGVPRAFDEGDFGIAVVGYLVMRLAMVSQWLRAARADGPRRRCALRYAGGIVAVQLLWVLWLVLPVSWAPVAFVVFAIAEVSVPIWAERAAPTTWHPHHIAERYGLFTLIVLGESVLAATTATQSALASGHGGPEVLVLAGGGLLIVFSMWWIYFERPAHHLLTTLRTSIIWGYSHLVVFGSAAAVGAGIEVALAYQTHEAHLSGFAAGMVVALPVAVYLAGVWALHVRPCSTPLMNAAYLVAVPLVLLTPFTGWAVPATGLVLAALVAASSALGR